MTTYAKTHHVHPDIIRKVHGYTHRKPDDPWQPADDPVRIETGFPDGTTMRIECTEDGQRPSHLRAELLNGDDEVIASVRGGRELMIEWAICHGDRKYVTQLRQLPVPTDEIIIQKIVTLDDACIARAQRFLESVSVDDFQGDETETITDEEFYDGKHMAVRLCGSSVHGSVVNAVLISPDGTELGTTDSHLFLLGTWTVRHAGTDYQVLLRRELP